MCGITGAIIRKKENKYFDLLQVSEIRGQDGTGFAHLQGKNLNTRRWDSKVSDIEQVDKDLFFKAEPYDILIGQNRLAIFGLEHNNDQPLVTDRFALVHNGNLFNFEPVFKEFNLPRKYKVDTELILRLIEDGVLRGGLSTQEAVRVCMMKVQGNFACLLIDAKERLLIAFRRDKPLWYSETQEAIYFFSTDRIGKKLFTEMQEVPNNSVIVYQP